MKEHSISPFVCHSDFEIGHFWLEYLGWVDEQASICFDDSCNDHSNDRQEDDGGDGDGCGRIVPVVVRLAMMA